MMLKIDNRDIEIIKILSSEGRISKSDLATRVNLTPTPCFDRLKKLENAGIIKGYRAEVELAKVAPHVMIFVVIELEIHQAETFQLFENAITQHDEVFACWALGGGFDYALQIITRDIDGYQRFIDSLLNARLGIARYFTYFVTKQIKAPGVFAFNMLLDTDPG